METTVQTIQPQSETLSLRQITDRVNVVQRVLREVMKEGTHYGKVPGCGNKPTLLKPGADVLAMTFQLVPSFEVRAVDLPNLHREYHVTCTMHNASGAMLGQGVGSCSTMEKKYRYRSDKAGNRVENEDIADVYNTCLKMGKKRAHIDATLTVTGASDLFTQDMFDEEEGATAAPARRTQHQQVIETQSGDTITGIIEDVLVKTGTSKTGKPWTRYGIKVSGVIYGTFSETVGSAAVALRDAGTEAVLTVERDGLGHDNCTAIEAAGKAVQE